MATQPSPPDLESEKNRILEAVHRLPAAFASASALGIKTSRAKAALAQLVEAGQLKRFGPNSRPVYRVTERSSESELIELVAEQLRTLHQGGAPALVPFSRLDEALKKLPASLREHKLPALKRLAQRREVIVFRHGRLNFIVFTASLGEYLAPAARAPSTRDDLPERIHRAYTEVAAAHRSPDVPIAEVYAKVGGPLGAFHQVLHAACLEHRAVPTIGEPAFASQTARDQALVIAGEKFLNIKFLS